MRTALRAIVALLLAALAAAPSSAGPQGASGVCGRLEYPSESAYRGESVANATLWASFLEMDGFANGTRGDGEVEVWVDDGNTSYAVRLEEILVRRYVGATITDAAIIALRIWEYGPGGEPRATHEFKSVDAGRPGGNLTLAAFASDGGLDIFWRWAFLLCDEAFPSLYYVFHASLKDGNVSDDNSVAYFESARPSRTPPTDLILLITAGIAASAIFLLARRALRSTPERGRDPDGRTIK